MLAHRPRIPLPGPGSMTPDQQKVFDSVVNGPRGKVVGPLRAAIHNPVLAERWQQLGETLRYNTVLDRQYSELAILVVARRWNCELEWTIHERDARRADLPNEVIEAIRELRPPEFSDPAHREIYEYARMMQNDGQVSDLVHSAVATRWGVVGVVELTALIGYYTMVAQTLNAHGIPLPDGEPPKLNRDGGQLPKTLSQIPPAA